MSCQARKAYIFINTKMMIILSNCGHNSNYSFVFLFFMHCKNRKHSAEKLPHISPPNTIVISSADDWPGWRLRKLKTLTLDFNTSSTIKAENDWKIWLYKSACDRSEKEWKIYHKKLQNVFSILLINGIFLTCVFL